VQKVYVGFYNMPIYSKPEEIKRKIAPELLQCLKENHVSNQKSRRIDFSTDKRCIENRVECYKKMGWV